MLKELLPVLQLVPLVPDLVDLLALDLVWARCPRKGAEGLDLGQRSGGARGNVAERTLLFSSEKRDIQAHFNIFVVYDL